MSESTKINVPIMAEVFSKGTQPEFLYWVGCAGAFDDRYKKVAKAFASILSHLNISYAVLGKEETCTGDPARRAGNEMLFQMQALTNIQTFTRYGVKKILTTCPHCYNIFKNEYPDLDGHYEVIHYTVFLRKLIDEVKIVFSDTQYQQALITYHDPCYLGRANGEYESARKVIDAVSGGRVEMKRNRSFALCCGAGGAQMFKEAEKGDKEIFIERTEEALETGAGVIATSCPFCMVMMTDGLKYKNKEEEIFNLDIAEIVARALGL
jgi:heterodisulfide reductase subunit D